MIPNPMNAMRDNFGLLASQFTAIGLQQSAISRSRRCAAKFTKTRLTAEC
jgi:hypothetical protein